MVEIEQRALRAFEQEVLAASEALLHQLCGVGKVGLQTPAPLSGLCDQLVEVETVDTVLALEGRILLGQDPGQLASQRRAVEQVFHADADAPGSIRVGRPDAAPSGADGGSCQSSLHRAVQGDVVRHDDVRVLADANAGHLDAAAGEHVQL